MPTDLAQAAAQRMAAAAVPIPVALDNILQPGQGGDGAVLHGQIHAIVNLTAAGPGISRSSPVAQAEGNPRAGEVIGLGQGIEFHAYLLGPGMDRKEIPGSPSSTRSE